MYVSDFRVSLNARISRGNQYPHVSQSLLYTPCLPSAPSSTISLIRSLSSGTRILPPCLYSLAGAAPSLVPCTVYHPYAERSGGKRNGAVRPSASDECDLKRESENTATCLSPLVPPQLPFYHPSTFPRARLDPSLPNPFHYPSPIFYQLPPRQPTYLPIYPSLRFSTPAATSHPSRHTTTKHSIWT